MGNHCCKDCHFLAKGRVVGGLTGSYKKFTWNRGERLNLILDENRSTAECFKGVWSKRLNPHLKVRDMIQKPWTEEECPFFIEFDKDRYHDMSLDAVSEVEQRRTAKRQWQQSMSLNRWVLLVAVVAAVAAIVPLLHSLVGWLNTTALPWLTGLFSN